MPAKTRTKPAPKRQAKKPAPRVFLTDKVLQDNVQEWAVPNVRRTQQATERIDDDPTAIELPEGTICVARTDEARDRLCADLGIEPLPRTTDYIYQAGDVAIVGSLSSTQPTRWARCTFS